MSKNYNRMFNSNGQPETPEFENAKSAEPSVTVDVNEKETEDVQEKAPIITAKVVGCGKLNVRREPTIKSEILGTINVGSELIVLDIADEWVKVSATGYAINSDIPTRLYGCVMKQYITI